MEFRASHRYAPVSARKARLVVDMVRGRPVNDALEVLEITNKRASGMTQKVIKAALAAAEDREDVDVDLNKLVVSRAWVDEAPDLPGFRYVPGPRGRYMPIICRRSHIEVRLAESDEDLGPKRKKKKKRKRKAKKSTAPAESTAPSKSSAETASEGTED